MRISDWSSDVCSSDLGQELAAEAAPARGRKPRAARLHAASPAVTMRRMHRFAFITLLLLVSSLAQAAQPVATVRVGFDRDGVPSDRKSVVEGKSVSVRVDLGGRRIIQKKQKQTEAK